MLFPEAWYPMLRWFTVDTHIFSDGRLLIFDGKAKKHDGYPLVI